MSITDELREWMRNNTVNCSDNRIALVAIADRIDEQHGGGCGEAYEKGVNDGIDADKNALGYVKLPVDADGEYIQAGDVLDGYGKTIEVVELRYGRSGWVIVSRDGNAYADTFAFTHHREPTVEDVLREFFSRYVTTKPKDEDDAILAEYAAKLRMAKEDA